jgi:hypothetical protein
MNNELSYYPEEGCVSSENGNTGRRDLIRKERRN